MLDLTVEQFKKYGDVQFDGVSEDNAHYALKLFFLCKILYFTNYSCIFAQ